MRNKTQLSNKFLFLFFFYQESGNINSYQIYYCFFKNKKHGTKNKKQKTKMKKGEQRYQNSPECITTFLRITKYTKIYQ